MPRTWYNLAAGPAPWAGATSYTSSYYSSTAGSDSTYLPTRNSTYFSTAGYSSYGTDLERGTTSSAGDSSNMSAYDADLDSQDTYNFTAQNSRTYSTGATFGIVGGLRSHSTSYSATSRAVENGNRSFQDAYTLGTSAGAFGGTSTGFTSANGYSLESYLSGQLAAGTNYSTYYSASSKIYTYSGAGRGSITSNSFSDAGTDTAAGSTSSTYSYAITNLLTYNTRLVTTTYTLDTQASGYYLTTVNTYDSDFDVPSYVTISTALTSGTGTDTATYPSTTLATESYTYLTTAYATRTSELMVAQTTTYLLGAFHEIPIISALSGEVLRVVTATGSSGVSGLADIAGATFTQTTLNSAFDTSTGGLTFAGTSSTQTVSTPIMSYGTVTITVSVATFITVTQQQFDGWIGGTQTEEKYLWGATSTSTTQRTGVQTFATSLNAGGGWPYTTHTVLYKTSLLSETVRGINSAGASAPYAVITPYTYLEWASYRLYTGSPGQSITAKRSPSQLFGAEGGGGAGVTRLERANGFQAPNALGSTGDQGSALSANSTFFIGAGNTVLGSPSDIHTPALTTASTAATSDSSYSFLLGATACSVTASRTASSTSTAGTVTSTYTTATVTQFTATITLAASANSFLSMNGNEFSPSGVTVLGGPHAWTGGQQNITLNGFGWRFTIGDGANTTSYKETRATSVSTAALGSSIIAAESFRAGVPSPALNAGLPPIYTFAFSAV